LDPSAGKTTKEKGWTMLSNTAHPQDLIDIWWIFVLFAMWDALPFGS
jgi:hypothetical protein